MFKGLINVDCDGVLVPNTHEDALFSKIQNEGYSFADSSQIFDWYTKLIDTKPLDVNHQLLQFLRQKKEEGHAVRLWTNRMYTLKYSTLKNLGDYRSLFDSFEFHSGRKHLTQVEGTIIDNSPKYLSCGEVGIHYEWR